MTISYAPSALTLRQLQYAVAVAEFRSFRKAAEACHVAQPSLSAQVAALEGALGAVLFERDRRRVLLTEAGGAFVQGARRLLEEAAALEAQAKGAADPLRGRLRIGILPTIAPYLLPGVMPGLSAALPELTVLWVEERTEVLVRMLQDGRIDAALLAKEARLGDGEQAALARDPFLLAMPDNHPLCSDNVPLPPVLAEQLSDAPFLLLEDGHCLRDQALPFCSGAGVRELAFRATSLPTLVQMVAAGAGLTLLPELAAATESGRAPIRLRRLSPEPYRTLILQWRAGSPISGGLRRLAGVLRGVWPGGQGGAGGV